MPGGILDYMFMLMQCVKNCEENFQVAGRCFQLMRVLVQYTTFFPADCTSDDFLCLYIVNSL